MLCPAKSMHTLCEPNSLGTILIFFKFCPSMLKGVVRPLGLRTFTSKSTFPAFNKLTE